MVLSYQQVVPFFCVWYKWCKSVKITRVDDLWVNGYNGYKDTFEEDTLKVIGEKHVRRARSPLHSRIN